MMRTTPHILITTPESLHILLTSLSGAAMFSALRGRDRRRDSRRRRNEAGATSRSRSSASSARRRGPLQRIGLSATQRPLEEIARFLGGWTPTFVRRSSTAAS
jgi:ATP-dependent Lhr-like helicase